MTRLCSAVALAIASALPAQSTVHESKREFSDSASWPATKPGDVELARFKPFRAVYERHYSQHGGPNAGAHRVDRVVVTAEESAWDGRPAALINVFDMADRRWSDTNGRALTMYADLEDLRLYLEIGPIPGKAKDYYVLRPTADRLVGTLVTTATGESRVQTRDTTEPGFGPGPWVWASMDLRSGLEIRLDPFHSVGANVLGRRIGKVVSKNEFKDLRGVEHDAWIIDSPGNLSSPFVVRSHVVERPPYLIAQYSVNRETGVERRGARLIEFELLEKDPKRREVQGRVRKR